MLANSEEHALPEEDQHGDTITDHAARPRLCLKRLAFFDQHFSSSFPSFDSEGVNVTGALQKYTQLRYSMEHGLDSILIEECQIQYADEQTLFDLELVTNVIWDRKGLYECRSDYSDDSEHCLQCGRSRDWSVEFQLH